MIPVVVWYAGAALLTGTVVPSVPKSAKWWTEKAVEACGTITHDDPVYYLIVTVIMSDGPCKKTGDVLSTVTTELCLNLTKSGVYCDGPLESAADVD